jgi:rhamnosyltransferase
MAIAPQPGVWRGSGSHLSKVKSPAKQKPDNLPMISAVLVAYHPEVTLLDNLRRLSGQITDIIIVDNGSGGESAKTVDVAGSLPGVRLIRNGSNLGIATALNIGIRCALQSGCQWIATFDQDSTIPEHYFEELFDAYNACPMPEKIGMIVPGQYSAQGTSATKPAHSGKPQFSLVMATMSSGNLIKAEVFATVGFFDDALFIDYVDADFCLRLQKNTLKILSATQVALIHELGTKQTRNFLCFQISFRVHAAWRYYYILRNRVIVCRRYAVMFPLLILWHIIWIPLELVRIACLEKERLVKLSAAFRGIWDGLHGKTGRNADFPK